MPLQSVVRLGWQLPTIGQVTPNTWFHRGRKRQVPLLKTSLALLFACQIILHPVNVVHPIGNIGMLQQICEERNSRFDPIDHEFRQTASQTHQTFISALAVNDELADETVVVGRYRVALIGAGIDPHAKPAGRMPIGDLAWARGESWSGSPR